LNNVLNWLKGNVVTVIMLVLMLAAIITAPILAGRWNESVRSDAESRAARMTQLTGLERTSVTVSIPGEAPATINTVVNPRLLDRYREVSGSLRADADRVREMAVAFNRKERGVLVPRLFPKMPEIEKDTLPVVIPDVMERAYRELLQRVRAGTPPAPESVVDAIAMREAQFIANNLRKAGREDLDASELRDLTEELTKTRLAKYGEAAEDISFYARLADMPVPRAPSGRLATIGEMFAWQWDYWVVEDILKGLAGANSAFDSVSMAPVKRVITLNIIDRVPTEAPRQRGSSGTGGFGGMGGGGLSGVGGVGAGGAQSPEPAAGAGGDDELGEPAIDSATPVAIDFSRSLTGRSSNHLYDVRRVELRIICATTALPEVIDALARRNFITVLELQMAPADPFTSIEDGFIYGVEPVSDVRMVLETVWLREWTAPFMPRSVRDALGVGAAAASVPASPAQAPADGGTGDAELDEYLRGLEGLEGLE